MDALTPPPPSGRPRPDAEGQAFDDRRPPPRTILDDCVHCGFCLPTCPTYALWGEEMDSPRGRILLLDLAERGEIGLTPRLVRHLDSCLGCMACVTACPSGVAYDRLIEPARAQIERRFERTAFDRRRRDLAFRLLPHPRRMQALGAAVATYRASGLQRLVRRSGVLDRLPASLRDAEALTPAITLAGARSSPPPVTPARSGSGLRVALLLGCVQRGFFGDVNTATARVLAAHGCEVLAPPDQGCCGALELHAGRDRDARRRARALVERLDALSAERIVVNSAGCGSALKEYGHLFADDPAFREQAAAFAARVVDVHELLDELDPVAGLRPLELRVAYHDACHLAHAQGVRDAPRRVLHRIPGLELAEIADPELCCGSAGVYNLFEPAIARELGDRKARDVAATTPDALAAGNPGCLIQIAAALGRAGTTVPTFHPVELLDASLRGDDPRTLLERRRRVLDSTGR